MSPYLYPTVSALQLTDACPGSAVLQRVGSLSEPASVGNAKHEHMAQRITLGVDDAVRALPLTAANAGLDEREAGIFAAQMRAFEWMPPKGSMVELGLCYMRDGSVIRLRKDQGGAGHYLDLPEGAWLPGTLDIMWAEPEPLRKDPDTGRVLCPKGSVLWVADYKMGLDKYVAPVETNRQVETLGMMAAKWTGAEQYVPTIIYANKGEGDWDTHRLHDLADLERVENSRRRKLELISEQRAKHAKGEPLDLVQGPQCEFCPSQTVCPAKTSLIKSVLDLPAPLGESPMTPADLARLAWLLPQIERFANDARTVLLENVKLGGSIKLADGKEWGPYEVEKTVLNHAIALPILIDQLGEEAAVATFRQSISKDAIEKTVKAQLAAAGVSRGVSKVMRRILGRIAEAGGIVKRSEARMGVHVPKSVANVQTLEEQLEASLYT